MARRRESVAETEDANRRDWATALRLHSSYPDQVGRSVYYYVRRVPLGLLLMFGAGLIVLACTLLGRLLRSFAMAEEPPA